MFLITRKAGSIYIPTQGDLGLLTQPLLCSMTLSLRLFHPSGLLPQLQHTVSNQTGTWGKPLAGPIFLWRLCVLCVPTA